MDDHFHKYRLVDSAKYFVWNATDRLRSPIELVLIEHYDASILIATLDICQDTKETEHTLGVCISRSLTQACLDSVKLDTKCWTRAAHVSNH